MYSVSDEKSNESAQDIVKRVLSETAIARNRRADLTVAAVIAVESDWRFFGETVRSVLEQTVVPGTILVADCNPQSGNAKMSVPIENIAFSIASDGSLRPAADLAFSDLKEHLGEIARENSVQSRAEKSNTVCIKFVSVYGVKSFGQAVDEALERSGLPQSADIIWLLHDDSRPTGENCLETLLETSRNTPSASVIGTKQVDWDSPEILQNAGYFRTRFHKPVSLVVDGEEDQEQYDSRRDVYCVSLAGALVKTETMRRLSGIDSGIGTFGESKEFCRRVCLSGRRVLVVPSVSTAHRRARFSGVRHLNGSAISPQSAFDSYALQIKARERYMISDISRSMWILAWLISLPKSLWKFVMLLVRKMPSRAFCELFSPWRNIADLPLIVKLRDSIKDAREVSEDRLNSLTATKEQIDLYKSRLLAFERERDVPICSPSVLMHWQKQAKIRRLWCFFMVLTVFAVSFAMNRQTIWNVFSSKRPVSDSMPSSFASAEQIFRAASTNYTFGIGSGMSFAPMPFLLILLAGTVLLAGHVSLFAPAILLLSASLSALSFWSLAGIVTRSNPVRVAGALSWAALPAAVGLYSQCNLPMLAVSVFLPASLAFVFKAVGMYRTEKYDRPVSSVQAAAWASVCMAAVVCCEPQLAVAYAALFAIFLVFVRSHLSALLLMPLPIISVLLPTLNACIKGAKDGYWRQIFADASIPVSNLISGTQQNTAQNLREESLISKLFSSCEFGRIQLFDGSQSLWKTVFAVSLLLVVVLALLSLFIPKIIRISRIMWLAALSGIALAAFSASTPIAADENGTVCGSVFPGLMLSAAALLCCVCMTAGSAAASMPAKIESLTVLRGEPAAESNGQKQTPSGGSAGKSVAGRAVLTALILCCCASWSAIAVGRICAGNTVKYSSFELPVIGQEYLLSNESHRILAISAEDSTHVKYAPLRTAGPDLIDRSAAADLYSAQNGENDVDSRISHDILSLMSGNDFSAAQDLTSLGFGGIYVPKNNSYSAKLCSDITASGGTQTVVDNDGGTYFRLTAKPVYSDGFDLTEYREQSDSFGRKIWMATVICVFGIYILTGIPGIKRTDKEAA